GQRLQGWFGDLLGPELLNQPSARLPHFGTRRGVVRGCLFSGRPMVRLPAGRTAEPLRREDAPTRESAGGAVDEPGQLCFLTRHALAPDDGCEGTFGRVGYARPATDHEFCRSSLPRYTGPLGLSIGRHSSVDLWHRAPVQGMGYRNLERDTPLADGCGQGLLGRLSRCGSNSRG